MTKSSNKTFNFIKKILKIRSWNLVIKNLKTISCLQFQAKYCKVINKQYKIEMLKSSTEEADGSLQVQFIDKKHIVNYYEII